MTEVKPICVLYYLAESLGFDDGSGMAKMNEALQSKMSDYHVLCIPSRQSLDGSCEDVRLQVFHPKDFTEIQFQELKDMVMEEIKKINNPNA